MRPSGRDLINGAVDRSTCKKSFCVSSWQSSPSFLINDHSTPPILVTLLVSYSACNRGVEQGAHAHAETIQNSDASKGTRGPEQLCSAIEWRAALCHCHVSQPACTPAGVNKLAAAPLLHDLGLSCSHARAVTVKRPLLTIALHPTSAAFAWARWCSAALSACTHGVQPGWLCQHGNGRKS